MVYKWSLAAIAGDMSDGSFRTGFAGRTPNSVQRPRGVAMALSLRENICASWRLPSDYAILAGRAELLSPRDRELIEAVLIHGLTASSLSRMTGSSARVVANRVKRLSAHLTSRSFLDAARALPYLPPAEAELARLHFCQGLSLRAVASRLAASVHQRPPGVRVSCHELRRRLDRLAAQIAMIRRISRGDSDDPLVSPAAAAKRWGRSSLPRTLRRRAT